MTIRYSLKKFNHLNFVFCQNNKNWIIAIINPIMAPKIVPKIHRIALDGGLLLSSGTAGELITLKI